MQSYNDVMVTDDMQDESQEQTQQQTQSTQQASQQTNASLDSHLWGYLQPCSSALTRIDFWKINPSYHIGRNTETNQVVMPGFKVSNQHCTITWDGSDLSGSSVIVQDLSSNGTFINGQKIGKNQTRILREGNEIAFGTCVPQPHNGGLEDYRFVYRHTAGGLPTEGLYAYYDISTELGKGSFATVMKAVSRTTGEWYAVKMIHESKNVRNPGDPPNFQTSRANAFAREISIMEKLKHPNICEMKEVFFQDNNDINIVLELIEGGDLLDYILRNNGLTEAKAKHIAYQICDALAYIHSKGVAHRDLKPENILLTKHNPPIVKVADFGLAKVVDSLTMLRTMCGTPSYLAPEVVRQQNQDGYDHVVDSWSVGVIIFSMLTNASPFIEDDRRDVRTRIITRTIDWGTLTNSGVSTQAQDFIRCLLEEDPLLRMPMANALNHPWLESYNPVYNHQDIAGYSMIPSVPESDRSFRNSVNEEFEHLNIESLGGAALLGNTANGVKREGSRTAPLQRRSHVLSQAAENGQPLAELPEEMIALAVSQEQQLAGPSNWEGANKRQNKRVHSELTPLSEFGSQDAEMLNESSPPGANGMSHKKGRSSDEEKDVAGGGHSVRGKGKGSGGRGRGAKSGEASEDEGIQLRRSTRQPQKLARRA